MFIWSCICACILPAYCILRVAATEAMQHLLIYIHIVSLTGSSMQ